MKKLLLKIRIFFRQFKWIKADLRLRTAIQKADRLFEETGNRHYVIPQDGTRCLIIFDRKSFRLWKRKGYISEKATMKDIQQECFYYTSDKLGNTISPAEMEIRSQFWRNYWDMCRKR